MPSKKKGDRAVSGSSLYRETLSLLRAGALGPAAEKCRGLIAAYPGNAEVLQLAGLVARQQGDVETAKTVFTEAIALSPENPYLHEHLGRVCLLDGTFDAAETAFRKALRLDANVASFHVCLGTALQRQGRYGAAVSAYENALRLDARHAGALCALGDTLRLMGNVASAVATLEKVVFLQPEMPQAHNNYALALQAQGDLDRALAHFERAAALSPRDALVQFNLGQFHDNMGHYEKAAGCYKKSISLDPDWKAPKLNLGTVYRKQGRMTESTRCFEQMLENDPAFQPALHNLGNAYRDMGQAEKAVGCFNRILATSPDLPNTRSNLLVAAHYCVVQNPSALFDAHRLWDEMHCKKAPGCYRFEASRDMNRRLRIGYLSPDFHNHSVSYFMAPIFSGHGQDQTVVFAYCDNVYRDEMTDRLQSGTDRWQMVGSLSDDRLAALIHRDRIDILVDLAGHTAHNRLLVFAKKPAPIQVTYLGYPDTTGLRAIDYRLTDAVADPPGTADTLHTETLVRLPGGFLCYAPPVEAPHVVKPGRDRIVFGSFNNSAKISPETISMWSTILNRLPTSTLRLKASVFADQQVRSELLAAFEKNGVSAERITLWRRSPATSEHLALYNEIDIALDTFPYNGTTTTCEALWMGTPVVTMTGNIHVTRVGASILTQVGLKEWIARNPEDYIGKAVDLAEDRQRLKVLHNTLRERMRTSPLMDAATFVAHLEAAYRRMWVRWCAGGRSHAPEGRAPNAADLVTTGEALYAKGDMDGARNAFAEALAVNPSHVTAHNNLGVLYWQEGKLGEAVRCIEKALSLDPDDAFALKNLDEIRRQADQMKTMLAAGEDDTKEPT